MKYRVYLELALIILLVALMYQRSNFLNNMVSHPLAKLTLLAGVVGITHTFGRNAGLISGLIVLLLFHNLFEGMENKDNEDKYPYDPNPNVDYDEKFGDGNKDADEDQDIDEDGDEDTDKGEGDENANGDRDGDENDSKTKKSSNDKQKEKTYNGRKPHTRETEKDIDGAKIISVTQTLIEPDDKEGMQNNIKDKTSIEDEMRKPKDSNKEMSGVGVNPQNTTNENDPMAMPSKTKEAFSILGNYGY